MAEQRTITLEEASEIARRRLTAIRITAEEEKDIRDQKKTELVKLFNVLLTDHGIKQSIELLYQGHEGEGVTPIDATIRTTPPVTLRDGLEVTVSENLKALSESHWTTDIIYVHAENHEITTIPAKGTLFSAGGIIENWRTESFVSASGAKAEIAQIDEGIILVNFLNQALSEKRGEAINISPTPNYTI